MKLQKSFTLLAALSLCAACGATLPAPGTAASAVAPQVQTQGPLELTIKPATAAAVGGQRLPVQFTIRNSGEQPVHSCLSSGRVVHLWGIDREYAYTVAEQGESQPSCEETLDLAPHAELSWSEEITIPAIAASSAKIVGFAQLIPEGCGADRCEPVWLSATYSPFTIEAGAATPPHLLDLRTAGR
jgi:hypothetical protein